MKMFGLNLFEYVRSGSSVPGVEVRNESPDFTDIKDTSELWNLVSKARNISIKRKDRNAVYARISRDSTISTALEMISEDASQPNFQTGLTYWVESSDPAIADELNGFLRDVVNINSKAFAWAYQVTCYGEMFLKTFHSERKEAAGLAGRPVQELNEAELDKKDIKKAQEFYEEIGDPSSIQDLMRFGQTVAFIESHGKDTTIGPPQDFIHFIADRSLNREDISLEVEDKETGKKVQKDFKVRYGTSFLEGVIQAYNIVELLEDILVLSRLSRSALFRLFMVNVGGASNKETVRILREVKNAMKSKENINVREGSYRSSSSSIPMGDNVFIPTRSGKGEIQYQSIGGDVDVKAMVDFDYFFDKLTGALKIPKAFLNSEPIGGQFANTSLTRLDARYARMVKRIITVLENGIKELCDYHLEYVSKPEWKGKFKVCSNPVSDAEETDKVTEITMRADAAVSVVNLVNAIEGAVPEDDKKKIIKHLLYKFLDINFGFNTEDTGDANDKPGVVASVVTGDEEETEFQDGNPNKDSTETVNG